MSLLSTGVLDQVPFPASSLLRHFTFKVLCVLKMKKCTSKNWYTRRELVYTRRELVYSARIGIGPLQMLSGQHSAHHRQVKPLNDFCRP